MSEAHGHDAQAETPEFQRMRAYDKEWSGPRFVGTLVITLTIALSVIYGLASLGSG